MEHGNQEIGLKKGPYLQLPVKDGITIMWETSESVPGYVRVYQGSCPAGRTGCTGYRSQG